MKDKYWFNTDHVLICYAFIGNYTWRLKDSGRQNVKTGGKEKYRFTSQLGIANIGKKLIPFLVFKGENSTCSSIFVLFLIS